MKILIRKIGLLIPPTITILFLSAVLASGDIHDNLKKSFVVASGGQLTLETDFGAIGARAVEGDTVDVEVIRKATALSEKDVHTSGGNIYIKRNQ